MAKMTTDDNDTGGGGKYTLEPGKYFFRVLERMETKTGKVFSTMDTTSSKDDPQIFMVVEVGDKQHTITVLESLTFSSAAMFRIRQFLLAVGAYPGHGVDIDLTAKMCIGLTGWCEVDNKKKDGDNFERTFISAWTEASVQDSHKIPGLIVDAETPNADGSEKDYSDDIPF